MRDQLFINRSGEQSPISKEDSDAKKENKLDNDLNFIEARGYYN